MRLLLTRPMFEAERTAQALRERGHEVLFAPLLAIENIAGTEIGAGPWSGVLITSGNAARAIAVHPGRGRLTSLRCFAVGPQTAAAAREAGFADVVAAGGDGADLARVVAQHVRAGAAPLLYLAGDDRARDMAAELAFADLSVQVVVVYRARAANGFPAQVESALRERRIDGVLHYSRRSTAIFVDCVRSSGLAPQAAALRHFCLSQRASEPLTEIGAKAVSVAVRPDEGAMLALIKS